MKKDNISVQVSGTMSLTSTQKAEVRAAMEAYATAYRKNDLPAMIALFSPRISGFGSGPDEIIRDHKDFVQQIRRDLGQAAINAVEFTDTQVFGEGPVAWVTTRTAITFTADGAGKQTMDGRSTMVLRNTGNRWLFEQIHFSMPYCGQAEGQSFPGA